MDKGGVKSGVVPSVYDALALDAYRVGFRQRRLQFRHQRPLHIHVRFLAGGEDYRHVGACGEASENQDVALK